MSEPEKSAEAFRTISEVAELLATPAHVLRFWEGRFTQIKPMRRAGGRRYYRPADVALIDAIRGLLHDDGLTIRGVQKMLRTAGVKLITARSPHGLAEAPPVQPKPAAPQTKSKPRTAAAAPRRKPDDDAPELPFDLPQGAAMARPAVVAPPPRATAAAEAQPLSVRLRSHPDAFSRKQKAALLALRPRLAGVCQRLLEAQAYGRN